MIPLLTREAFRTSRASGKTLTVTLLLLLIPATGRASIQTLQPSESPKGQVARLEAMPSIEGSIRSTVGQPLMGVLVSVFGASLRDGGATALTDDSGRFRLPRLPPGLYVLHAYLTGFLPMRSGQIEVSEGGVPPVPVSLSLTPAGDGGGPIVLAVASVPGRETDEKDAAERVRELKWLLRHGRRNVLREQEAVLVANETTERAPSVLLDVGVDITGEVGVMASESGLSNLSGSGLDARLAYARLDIPSGADRHWLVSAQLMESALSSWTARAEFVTHERAGQDLRAGVAYGNYLYGELDELRPPEGGFTARRANDRSTEWFGSAFGQHRVKLGPAELETALRYHHFSYLGRSDYFAPRVAFSWSPDGRATVLRGSLDYTVNAPGGEDLELLTRMVTVDVSGIPSGSPRLLSAERTVRYQVDLERQLGESGAVEVRFFDESANDQLLKSYFQETSGLRGGPGGYRLANGGDFRSRGVGFSVSRRFGGVEGSVGYTFGRAQVVDAPRFSPFAADRDQEIHDLTTTVETAIDRTRTRLYAAYKLTSHFAGVDDADRGTLGSRFNVQVQQGLPFIGWNGTEWELLLAIRNIFYQDMSAASFLDELFVVDSPRRVVGGLAVKF